MNPRDIIRKAKQAARKSKHPKAVTPLRETRDRCPAFDAQFPVANTQLRTD